MSNRYRRPTTIGNYVVLDVLSQNSMTRVYRVRRSAERTEFALKNFICMQLSDAEARERFHREIRAGMSVRHANVCETVDWGYDDTNSPYVVLELLSGETLDTLQQRGDTIPASEAMAWACDTLRCCIHQAGLVHRGVHPDNLFVCADRRLKILDFGLARRNGWDPWTQDGASMGRLPYVAPEQLFDAHRVGAPADLFVTALVLFRTLTGALPFTTSDRLAMMVAMTNGGLVLATVRPESPPALVEWMDRMLRFKAADRYQTADEALHALQTITA